MKVLVLGGGDSPEREVSLRSAKYIADAARQTGLQVEEYDPKDGLDFLKDISKDTVILPILHGQNGEDGVLQAEFEKRQLSFLGSSSEVMRVTFDKAAALKKLAEDNISIAEGAVVTAKTYLSHPLAKKPHVLKANHGGSSIGTIIIRDPTKVDLKQAIEEVFNLDSEAVLEELIEGPEITIPVLDQKALPALEVRPPEGGEFDYANKYNGLSAELCPPPSLSEEKHTEVKKLAEHVNKIFGCRHLSRVDTMMRSDGSFIVLEINTIPGLTDQSLYPRSAKAAGMDMPALVKKFVELVKRDYNL